MGHQRYLQMAQSRCLVAFHQVWNGVKPVLRMGSLGSVSYASLHSGQRREFYSDFICKGSRYLCSDSSAIELLPLRFPHP